jgi:phosphate:Na+ symporter
MMTHIVMAIGGIGLFLAGMIAMTEGLKGLAGDDLRRLLRRVTRSPYSGAAAGAAATALMQSSSAVIIMTVGFVGSGLMRFSQALGIILGATVGTTVTGWLVVIVGFKLQLGNIVLPLILAGALMRLFGRGGLQHAGWALAGFGLLFVGIDAMKEGMGQLEGVVTPNLFPDASLIGSLWLVLIGAAITIVTQSSSAGVAGVLVALGSGSIVFQQAALLVIGMNVGTTATAALATLGGNSATRQTGMAHVIYNLLLGAAVFLAMPLLIAGIDAWQARGGAFDSQLTLVGFHTAFTLIGALVALPLAPAFARIVQRVVPDDGASLASRLDETLLAHPGSAIDAVAATLQDVFHRLAKLTTVLLRAGERFHIHPAELAVVQEALDAARVYAGQIRTGQDNTHLHARHVSCLHALDHLARLAHRCGQIQRVRALQSNPELRRLSHFLSRETAKLRQTPGMKNAEWRFDRTRRTLHAALRGFRSRTVEAAAVEGRSAEGTLLQLDAIRWLQRTSYHYWRIAHHLVIASRQAPHEAAQIEDDEDEAALDVEAD